MAASCENPPKDIPLIGINFTQKRQARRSFSLSATWPFCAHLDISWTILPKLQILGKKHNHWASS
jgi:hypothetical protein